MHEDDTIHYYADDWIEYYDDDGMKRMEQTDRIIRVNDPYVFRVRDEYHQLFIGHYYDGEDYTSGDGEDASIESEDSSNQ